MSLSGIPSNDQDEGEAPIVAEINITPLTDIFLVLLIIFMVTSSVLSQTGVDIQLPKSKQASQASDASQPTIVSLTASGDLRVNGTKVKDSEFEAALKMSFTQGKSSLVILEGDEKAILGSAITILDRCKKAGAEKVSIATQVE